MLSPCFNSSCLVWRGSWDDPATPVTRGSWGHEHAEGHESIVWRAATVGPHVDPLTASSSAVCPKDWRGPPLFSSSPDSATNIRWLLRQVIVCRISQTFSVWLFAHVFTARLTLYFHLVLYYYGQGYNGQMTPNKFYFTSYKQLKSQVHHRVILLR